MRVSYWSIRSYLTHAMFINNEIHDHNPSKWKTKTSLEIKTVITKSLQRYRVLISLIHLRTIYFKERNCRNGWIKYKIVIFKNFKLKMMKIFNKKKFWLSTLWEIEKFIYIPSKTGIWIILFILLVVYGRTIWKKKIQGVFALNTRRGNFYRGPVVFYELFQKWWPPCWCPYGVDRFDCCRGCWFRIIFCIDRDWYW